MGFFVFDGGLFNDFWTRITVTDTFFSQLKVRGGEFIPVGFMEVAFEPMPPFLYVTLARRARKAPHELVWWSVPQGLFDLRNMGFDIGLDHLNQIRKTCRKEGCFS